MKPEFIFESSWEVCNKVGGIHTVITSKISQTQELVHDQLIFIGPDIQQDNGEFMQDDSIFSDWRNEVQEKGLRVRTGRWNIDGLPYVILVDFSTLISNKNDILTQLWERYEVDSISGHWDYIEAVLFGYSAGQIIESFTQFYLSDKKHIIAHFHEWSTSSAVLYLKSHAPHLATVFTTHATSLGRSICSNGQQLYKQLSQINTTNKSKELGIISKHSIEKITSHNTDCFTTVSEITAEECEKILDKPVDVVCPNGFKSFSKELLDKQKKDSRNLLLKVIKGMTGSVSDDTLLIATSGRYEFRNKGIDMFISVLSDIRKEKKMDRDIVGFILVPSNHFGPKPELQDNIFNKNDNDLQGEFITHNLHNVEDDIIIKTLNYYQFENNSKSRVKIFFVPTYLDGKDGIFNVPYYELLAGFDISIFASYYEPWGYTPLESIALGVPTITSTLAGFGRWAQKFSRSLDESVLVVKRDDDNYEEASKEIMYSIINLDNDKLQLASEKALHLARKAAWKIFYKNYFKAYSIALKKTEKIF